MTEHLSTEIVERFNQQAVGTVDRRAIYDHILKCEPCRQRVVDSRSEAVALKALSYQLLPTNTDETYHLDYELIEGYVEDRLDKVDRDTTQMHLEVCSECSAEVRDLRDSLATMRAASLPQLIKDSALHRLLDLRRLPVLNNPLRVSAIIALAAFAMIAAVVVWRLRSGTTQTPASGNDLSAEQKTTPIQSAPPPALSNSPSPNPEPSPHKASENNPKNKTDRPSEELIVLNDGPGKVTF